MRGVLLLAFPAMVGLILLGAPGISVLFQRRAWTAEDTAATAWALAFFALGIAGHCLLEVLSRAFYALSDTRTPVLIGIASVVSNIVLSLVFVHIIGNPASLSRGPFAGLALANSLTTLLEGFTLWLLLRRRIGDLNDRSIVGGASRSLAAAVGMGEAAMARAAAKKCDQQRLSPSRSRRIRYGTSSPPLKAFSPPLITIARAPAAGAASTACSSASSSSSLSALTGGRCSLISCTGPWWAIPIMSFPWGLAQGILTSAAQR